MKTATFHNFTTKPFTGYWNGKAKTFKAGERVAMEDWRASHYAKHLANQVLLTSGKASDENYTSPKRPEQVPRFKELFDRACIVDESAEDGDQSDADMAIAAKSHPQEAAAAGPGSEPQIVEPPADDEDDFEGAKQ